MATVLETDLTQNVEPAARNTFVELSVVECASVVGGRFKLPFQHVRPGSLLMTPDGEPVTVYVDGVRINSVSDGFVHI